MTDDDAKLRLYLAHRSALIDYATPIVGDRMRAEDLVQEAYFRFAPAGQAEHPLAYLYRIVRNLALDWKRRVSAESRRDQVHLLLSDPSPTAPSPEDAAVFREDLRLVEAALAELPPGMRTAFEMHRLGGRTFQQIAADLGVSVATAARWAQQALVHVAKRLQEADG